MTRVRRSALRFTHVSAQQVEEWQDQTSFHSSVLGGAKSSRYLLPFKIVVVSIDEAVSVDIVLTHCLLLVRGAPE